MFVWLPCVCACVCVQCYVHTGHVTCIPEREFSALCLQWTDYWHSWKNLGAKRRCAANLANLAPSCSFTALF